MLKNTFSSWLEVNYRVHIENASCFHWSLWFDLIEDASENSKICSILSFSTVVYISAYSLLCMWNHPSLLLHFITYDLMLYPKQFRKFRFYWSLVKQKIQGDTILVFLLDCFRIFETLTYKTMPNINFLQNFYFLHLQIAFCTLLDRQPALLIYHLSSTWQNSMDIDLIHMKVIT